MSIAPRRTSATLDDLAKLRDAGHVVELIDGEIVYKALPSPAHGGAQIKTGALLDGFNRRGGTPRGPGGWWLMTEVEVLYARAHEVFRHDLVGFRRDLYPQRPSDMPVSARPDWVAEVLSPSTARNDTGPKQQTLHAHQVPYYWIIDPEHRTLTVMRRADERYPRILDAGVSDKVRAEPFDAIELDVGELFDVEDARGP
jgi:Uma2 family endonuclease